ERYGDEFVELLIDDMHERGHSSRTALSVVHGACVARAREAGVGATPLGASEQVDASMTTLVWALGVCFLVGITIWSQVVIGWRWEPPSGHAVAVAMVLMSAAAASVSALALVAAIPIAWTLVGALARH